jgi:hypothetical protein
VHLMVVPRGKKLVLGSLIEVFQTQPFCKINGHYYFKTKNRYLKVLFSQES